MKKALIILGIGLVAAGLVAACGGAATPSPTPPPPTATPRPPTATVPPPTVTSPPRPASTSAETGLEKHKFKFVSPLGTQEESEDIEHTLTGLPGIKEALVDEVSVSVEYDPDVITLDELQKAIESLGYEVTP